MTTDEKKTFVLFVADTACRVPTVDGVQFCKEMDKKVEPTVFEPKVIKS